jgi:EF-hand domain pair
MAAKHTDAELNKMRRLFNSFDVRGQGTIKIDELRIILEGLGVEPSEQLFEVLDPDASGAVTFVEFMNAFDLWTELSRGLEGEHEECHYHGTAIKLSDEQVQRARDTFTTFAAGNSSLPSKELYNKLVKNFSVIFEHHPDAEAIIHREAEAVMTVIDADGGMFLVVLRVLVRVVAYSPRLTPPAIVPKMGRSRSLSLSKGFGSGCG